MNIKKIGAKTVLDSRKQKTIQVIVKTEKGNFISSAPAGKSTGEHEVKSYFKSIEEDIDFINEIDIGKINEKLERNKIINSDSAFNFLGYIEKITNNNIGGNSLFALEASLLKAISKENRKELFELIISSESEDSEDSKFAAKSRDIIMPKPVGNTIGGGLHSKGRNGKRPDFQEFLFIANGKTFKESFEINKKAYNLTGKIVKKSSGFWINLKNDEGAYETGLSNEEILEIMKKVQELIKKDKQKIDIGLDVASSSFYKDEFYVYKNFHKELDKNSEIKYITKLIKKYGLLYVEDPLNENDFSAFSELMFETKNSNCLIVGDDLTTTNPARLEKAIRLKSINAIIVKPNQIGSLIKVKQVVEIAKKNNIKTIISHRSGETMDDTIADLAVGFQCDFIKTGIYGKVREVKLKRLMKIEKMLKK